MESQLMYYISLQEEQVRKKEIAVQKRNIFQNCRKIIKLNKSYKIRLLIKI